MRQRRGALICDEIVEPGAMDAALERVVQGLTSSGVVSAASNRRAFRVTQEPLDMFRYFAVYAREQARSAISPALISNLERYWNAQNRNRDAAGAAALLGGERKCASNT